MANIWPAIILLTNQQKKKKKKKKKDALEDPDLILDGEITKREVQVAIKNLNTVKSMWDI